MGKKEDYEKLIGRKFRPTFKSNIDHYEIRGYDESTNMVFTKVYPCDGAAFDDEIEEQYLIGGFENGDYEVCDMPHFPDEQKTFVLHNYQCLLLLNRVQGCLTPLHATAVCIVSVLQVIANGVLSTSETKSVIDLNLIQSYETIRIYQNKKRIRFAKRCLRDAG